MHAVSEKPKSDTSTKKRIVADTNKKQRSVKPRANKKPPSWSVSRPVGSVEAKHINAALAIYQELGLSKTGAAYIVGNFVQESPRAFVNPCEQYGDGGQALGFGQWHPGRRADMPCGVREQLIWAYKVEMPRDAAGGGYVALSERLRGNDAAYIMQGIQQWERYGHEGARYQYGQQILAEIQ